ncbi:MAG: AAA family ATPase [Thiobacillaceae bacterium]|jgi:general secretion pathway protein A|nr:AAA family ATPase [Thiobacillaceae bacterium]
MTSMYLNYFGLAEAPFSIAPAPRYLYMSQRHQDALAHLLYGVSGEGGFVLLTGEVGTGKTTISRCLLEQIPESCDVAYIFNPKLTVEELLSTICVEFGIACPPGNTSIKVFIDCINAHLLDAHARGRHSVLIIDEAQNLSADVLEQMRLLTNLETNDRKLLQIILIGQPELATMLERPDLRQLAQRIVARYHLGKLSKTEVSAYVQHRLEVAGTQRQLFPPVLMGRLHQLSGGIPRIINVLCDRALLGTYAQGKERVDRATLEQAAREVFPQASTQRRGMRQLLLASLAVFLVGALALVIYRQLPEITMATAQQPVTQPVPPSPHENAEEPASESDSAAALPEVLAWPADEPSERSRDMAYAALFKAWGADYQGTDPCQQAETLGLRCQAGRGGLDELRTSNRPAVLSMRDEQGREFFATLTALTADSATFAIGTKTASVALSALASQWSGYYSLLWRVPPVTQRVIRPGDHGAAVEWLSTQLAKVQGGVVAVDSDRGFDDVLTTQVKRFQLSQGLTPDGNAGPQTLNRLVNLADQTAPRLLREQGDS